MAKITVYISQHCSPCQTLKELIGKGKYRGEIEVVDIETDEGFDRFNQAVLSKQDGHVPSAYNGDKECEILVNDEDESLVFRCPQGDSPSSPSS